MNHAPCVPEGAHAHESPITEGWKWTTVLGNAVIGAAEMVTGNVSTLSVTADGLHNAADAGSYYLQAENMLDPSLGERQRERRRKAAHWIIALSSAGMAAKAGVDMTAGVEHVAHPLAGYAAGASLALNGWMLSRLRRGRADRQESVGEHDLAKHFWKVDIPSAALAVAGVLLQRYSVPVEQLLAVGSGAYGAYAFRPSRRNLAHSCLGEHGHKHAPPMMPELPEPRPVRPLPPRRRLVTLAK